MISALILDQDGTLYPSLSPLSSELRRRTKEWLQKALGVSSDAIDDLYSRLQAEHPHPYDGFKSVGLSPEEYLEQVFDRIDPAAYLSRDEHLRTLLGNIGCPKFVVTLSSLSYASKLQKALGIREILQETVSMIDLVPHHGKDAAYTSIRKRIQVPLENILVVGDNILLDIKPALAAGFPALLVGCPPPGYRGANIESIYELEDFLHRKSHHKQKKRTTYQW